MPVQPLQSVENAEPLTGPTIQRYQELARQHSLWLSLGGFQEEGPDVEHLYNCHVIVNSAGELVSTYRKVALEDIVDVHQWLTHEQVRLLLGAGCLPA